MKYRLEVFLFGFLLTHSISCSDVRNDSNSNRTLSLTSRDVNKLFSLLKISGDTAQNIHIQFSEHLNDSTAILSIWRNSRKPTNELSVCAILEFNGSNVFIYDNGCQMKIPNHLLSKNEQQSPFFIPDSGFWEILAMHRKGNFVFYQISFFTNVDEEIPDPGVFND